MRRIIGESDRTGKPKWRSRALFLEQKRFADSGPAWPRAGRSTQPQSTPHQGATAGSTGIVRACEPAYRALGKVMADSFDAMVREMSSKRVNIRLLGGEAAQGLADVFPVREKLRSIMKLSGG